jgi:multisubunit Na+/H+ antiporter MnhB subunit
MRFRRKKRKCIDFADAKSKGVTLREWVKDCELGLRRRSLNILLSLFACIVVVTLALMALSALGIIHLSNEFVPWLVKATIGELLTVIVVILKKLWDI